MEKVYSVTTKGQRTMVAIETVIDIIYVVEILLCFVKKTRAFREFSPIAYNYLSPFSGTFLFDFIGTVPGLVFAQSYQFYFFKLFRCLVHIGMLMQPLDMIMRIILQKKSKKRQNDLITFCDLIMGVIYISHLCGCIWIHLGGQYDCKLDRRLGWDENTNLKENCVTSWIYANDFELKSNHTQYIFAFYWIFEVITTVGYGDYSGKTNQEYIFSIALEFIGLTFFSFLMGSINSIFNTTDSFEALIEEKLDSLDMWIKKIEKSNKPYHIQPTLYNDIRRYVEQAFLYDFNLVIEEF